MADLTRIENRGIIDPMAEEKETRGEDNPTETSQPLQALKLADKKRRPRRRATDPTLVEASAARVKARKAAHLMITKGMSKSEAMRKAGYSEGTIKSGNHVALRSEFQRLLNEALPASEVIDAIKRGIRSEVVREFLDPKTGQVVEGKPQSDYHASVKFCELYAKSFGIIARQDEIKVTHEVRLADEIAAARERAKLAAVTVDATPLDVVVGGSDTTTNSGN
jgi:hypothetical protein